MVPVQVWLPPGYAAAPGPARAVMAGVAVNVGFYGMWRTLQLLGPPPVWLVVAVLIIAGVTAVLGIAHAAVHADLAHARRLVQRRERRRHQRRVRRRRWSVPPPARPS